MLCGIYVYCVMLAVSFSFYPPISFSSSPRFLRVFSTLFTTRQMVYTVTVFINEGIPTDNNSLIVLGASNTEVNLHETLKMTNI